MHNLYIGARGSGKSLKLAKIMASFATTNAKSKLIIIAGTQFIGQMLYTDKATYFSESRSTFEWKNGSTLIVARPWQIQNLRTNFGGFEYALAGIDDCDAYRDLNRIIGELNPMSQSILMTATRRPVLELLIPFKDVLV